MLDLWLSNTHIAVGGTSEVRVENGQKYEVRLPWKRNISYLLPWESDIFSRNDPFSTQIAREKMLKRKFRFFELKIRGRYRLTTERGLEQD
ncbi:hypothetical protein CDAR_69871 [Caerostris darwini]|uniref:Uncharacterized protein n=1 Tax=Caerostris darwini TaxID=1538125 RepID=A0AAV4T3D6_9ARAC|nr:hypothetical protein CDAR_69871 [Caerostris darwini]